MIVCCFLQWWIVGTLAGVTGGVWLALDSVNASDPKAMPSALPWTHKSLIVGFDHARYILCAISMDKILYLHSYSY